MAKKKDKYDEEIAELLDLTEEDDFRAAVQDHWDDASPLFQTATPVGWGMTERGDGKTCGCLTQIRRGESYGTRVHAWTPALTKAIKADKRIPTDPTRIKREDLPVFAEWQRRLDKELGR